MKVKDVMITDVGFCTTGESLMKAAEIMRLRDCGVVPIVDEDGRVAGMLTDRDICLAIAARNRKASDVKTIEILNGGAIVCLPDEKLTDALRKMRKNQIKRLAVIDENHKLLGILSIGDILLAARKNKKLKKKIYSTLKKIAAPRPIVLREVPAKDA